MPLDRTIFRELRTLARKRKPIEIEGLGTFKATRGFWAFEEKGARPGEVARAIHKTLRRDRRCELPMGVFAMQEVRTLGGGKARLVRRYNGFRSGAVPNRERIYPGEGFEGDLGFTFKRNWTQLDPLFARWADRLASALELPTGIEPARLLDTIHTRAGLSIGDCLETFHGGVVGATRGIDWIDGLITAVALAESDRKTPAPAVRQELLDELRSITDSTPRAKPAPQADAAEASEEAPTAWVFDDRFPPLDDLPSSRTVPVSCLETTVVAAWIRDAGEAMHALLTVHGLTSTDTLARVDVLRGVRRFRPLGETWVGEVRALASSIRHPRVASRLHGFARALEQVATDHAYHNWADLSDHPDDEDEGMSLWHQLEDDAHPDPHRGMAELSTAILALVPLSERDEMRARLASVAT